MTYLRLTDEARRLDEAQIELLLEMATAFGWDVKVWENPESELISDGFGASLLNRLRIHHATSEEKFTKTSFEFAFKVASRFAGRRAYKTIAHTYQGADIVVDGERWSLKTEGARNMSPDAIVISKFSEARWIRDCRNGEDFARETACRLGLHLAEYDRVLTLRSRYVSEGRAVRYDLVEIPHEMLNEAVNLRPESFSQRTNSGSSSAKVNWRGSYAFTLVLDGSVEKVTLRNIKISSCFTHASFIVPVLPLDED